MVFENESRFIMAKSGAAMIDEDGNTVIFPSNSNIDNDGVDECDACRINLPDDDFEKGRIECRVVWPKDQKAKSDAGKPKLSLVPRQIIFDICRVREYGNSKYPDGGPDNWKQVDVQRYRDALYRHFMAYLDDPKGVDEESGLPHLWHMACNCAFLCELEKGDK